ncbi:hypothetical protein [Cupriavidus sp. CP313]
MSDLKRLEFLFPAGLVKLTSIAEESGIRMQPGWNTAWLRVSRDLDFASLARAIDMRVMLRQYKSSISLRQ